MFNLGDRVHAVVDGEITEIRKVGDKVRYTVQSDDYTQAYVYEEDLCPRNYVKEGER